MKTIIEHIKQIIKEGFDEKILETDEMKGIRGGLDLLHMMSYKQQNHMMTTETFKNKIREHLDKLYVVFCNGILKTPETETVWDTPHLIGKNEEDTFKHHIGCKLHPHATFTEHPLNRFDDVIRKRE